MKRAPLLALALTTFASCKRVPPPGQRIDDGWGYVRRGLTSGQFCFAGEADYCPADPEFIDGLVQPRLDALYGGEMPLRKAHVEATLRLAAIELRKAQTSDVKLRAIEGLIESRYLNPKVDLAGDEVTVDFGAVPGTLRANPITYELSYMEAPLAPDGEWAASELSRALTVWTERYPGVPVLRVVVKVPFDMGVGRFTYRYIRASGTIVVRMPRGELRTTRRGIAFESDLEHLTITKMVPCLPSSVEGPVEIDPPRVCLEETRSEG